MKKLASYTSLFAVAVALVVPFTVKAELYTQELSTSPVVEITYVEQKPVVEEVIEEVITETSPVLMVNENQEKIEDVVEEVEEETEEAIEEEIVELEVSIRDEVVDYALSFIGGSYVFGGTNPNTGVDCSGFTQYVMRNAADVEMNRTSTAQSTQGETVSADEMQPGDLVFYSNGSSVNHVAMYIGDGQVVHASTEKTGIKISNWDYRDPVRIANVIGE